MSLSGTKPYFFKSLRISFSAACLFLFVWTSTSRTSPSASTARHRSNHAAIDFQIGFVRMPGGVGFGTAFAQVRRDHRPEMVHPAADRVVGDRDAALRQKSSTSRR